MEKTADQHPRIRDEGGRLVESWVALGSSISNDGAADAR